MSQALAVAAWNSLVGKSESRYRTAVRDAVLIAAGSLLVAGAAQVVIPLPFTPVPITGQTFAVLLVGAALGAGRGAASLALYLGEGVAGLPFFAGGASGLGVITGATGGCLVGFVFAGALVGFLAQRGWDRRFASALGAMLTGNVVIYFLGVLGLATFMGASPLSEEVLLAGLYPFVPGDLIKVYLAAVALPSAWRLVSD